LLQTRLAHAPVRSPSKLYRISPLLIFMLLAPLCVLVTLGSGGVGGALRSY
jgi:hypothetical protein